MKRSQADPLIFDLYMQRMLQEKTLRDIAVKAGVGRGTIAEAERGVHSPTLSTLRAWADTLDMSIMIRHNDDKLVSHTRIHALEAIIKRITAIADWIANTACVSGDGKINADLIETKIRRAMTCIDNEDITCTCDTGHV